MLWKMGSNIPVCWEPTSQSDEEAQRWVREAVTATWQRESSIRFVGWGPCASTSSGVRIAVEDSKDAPHTERLGTALDGYPSGVVFNFTFKQWNLDCKPRENCVKTIAVHEFGHVLAFAHEQDRPDALSCWRGRSKANPETSA